jgi:hypothetical protein
MRITDLLTYLGDNAHPAEVEVLADGAERVPRVRVVVRPRNSSRTFILEASVRSAVEVGER